MSGYLHFIPEFVLCTNSSLFWFRIANELSEFRNYLFFFTLSEKYGDYVKSAHNYTFFM